MHTIVTMSRDLRHDCPACSAMEFGNINCPTCVYVNAVCGSEVSAGILYHYVTGEVGLTIEAALLEAIRFGVVPAATLLNACGRFGQPWGRA